MSRSRITASVALAGLLLFAAGAAGASTVTCESTNNAYKACPVNASSGVRLSRQLSSQGCWEHDTWGYDANKIWVTNGCRAEFQVGEQKSAGAGNAIAAAAVVGLAAAAVVASNHNDNHHDKHHNGNYNYNDNYNNNYNNNYNYNYGRNYDDRYPDDYRGRDYKHNRYGYNGYRGDPIRTFSCESNKNRTSYCDVPTRGHVEIFRQRSSSPCTYGRTWGVNGRRVWVEDGCRAEFAVY